MIRSEEHHGVGVLAVEGDLAGQATIELRNAAQRFLDRRINDVVIDLEKTSTLDSSALETLLWLRRRCDVAAGQFTLAGANQTVIKILEMTRLEHRFPRASDVTAALKVR